MNLTVGFIPYLNMVPFHQGFGPDPIQDQDVSIKFKKLSPRALGLEADVGRIDAGAISLVDAFRLSGHYAPLGNFGVGVKHAAGSVLLFSQRPLGELQGMCAVTDETSTSVRLLQVLLDKRYKRVSVNFGRIASGAIYDGSADSLLLIGDEALRASREGIKGLPVVTDLATEWYAWQGTPFVFARWMASREAQENVEKLLYGYLEKSLMTMTLIKNDIAVREAEPGFSAEEVAAYWDGFLYELTPEHHRSIKTFRELIEAACLTV